MGVEPRILIIVQNLLAPFDRRVWLPERARMDTLGRARVEQELV